MSRSMADRYATAAELRDDLDRYLAGGRVTATGYRYPFRCRDVIAERPRRVRRGGTAEPGTRRIIDDHGSFATLSKGEISGLEIFAWRPYSVSGWRFYTGRSGYRGGGLDRRSRGDCHERADPRQAILKATLSCLFRFS